jgi:signal transduction histidine kinase
MPSPPHAFAILDAVEACVLVADAGRVVHANERAKERFPQAVGGNVADLVRREPHIVWTCRSILVEGSSLDVLTVTHASESVHGALLRRVAHDLRGPVSASAMAAQHLERILPPDPLPHELVTGIRKALREAAALLRTLDES